MPLPLIMAAIAAAPSIYKAIKGIGQSAKGNSMNPNNPGYRMNQGLIDNAKTLSDQYGNYTMPGYSNMVNNVNSTYQNAFSAGEQGASSSADVLDLATRMAYGKNTALNQLGVQNAQGKQSMLGAYLSANAAAGQEYVNKNAYDRDVYQGQVREKAAYIQAGAENTYSALDGLAGTASNYLANTSTNPTTKQTMGEANGISDLPQATPMRMSVNSAFNQYWNPDGTPRRQPVRAKLAA